MRIAVALLLCFFASALEGQPGEPTIIDFKVYSGLPLNEALKSISARSALVFSYNPDAVSTVQVPVFDTIPRSIELFLEKSLEDGASPLKRFLISMFCFHVQPSWEQKRRGEILH